MTIFHSMSEVLGIMNEPFLCGWSGWNERYAYISGCHVETEQYLCAQILSISFTYHSTRISQRYLPQYANIPTVQSEAFFLPQQVDIPKRYNRTRFHDLPKHANIQSVSPSLSKPPPPTATTPPPPRNPRNPRNPGSLLLAGANTCVVVRRRHRPRLERG